jgi:enoyl-CoA hydratase/carnithine racemase
LKSTAPLQTVREGRVITQVSDGIAVLTLNRPEKRNALDGAQIDALFEAIEWFREAPDIRVAVLTGGPRVFSAGGDIEMFQEIGPDDGLSFTRRGYDLLRPLETGEKPIIAAVRGYCLAGGLELALACDFIIAGEEAQFGFGEVDLGLIPGWGGTVRLARAIPIRLARQIILTSQRLSAREAQRIGLVNEVTPDEITIERAVELAREIASKPPLAVRAAKMVIESAGEGDVDGALALERSAAAALFASSDVRSRVAEWIRRTKAADS